MEDFYEELSLDPQSSLDEINKALSQLESTWKRREITNPEKATTMLAVIIRARKVFSSETSRQEYDAALAKSKEPKVDNTPSREEQFNKWYQDAVSYVRSKQYDLAKIAIDSALSFRDVVGEDDNLYHITAYIYRLNHIYVIALDYINKAIILNPKNGSHYLEKAFNYLDQLNPTATSSCVEKMRDSSSQAALYAEAAGDKDTASTAYGLLAYSYWLLPAIFTNAVSAEQYAKKAIAFGDATGYGSRVLDGVEIERKKEEKEAEERKRRFEEERKLREAEQKERQLQQERWEHERREQEAKRAKEEEEKRKKERKERTASVLYIISWIVLLANILFCVVPFIRNGSFVYSDPILYGLNFRQILIFGLVSVALMCFATNFGAKGYLGKVLSWIWSFFICFGVATIRYTQMGFNAANASNTWKFFGILIATFTAVLIGSAKLGDVTRVGSSVIRSHPKPKFCVRDVISLVVLIGTTAAGIMLLQDLDRFYFWTKNYNLFDISVWVITIACFFVFSSSLKRNEIVDAWFFAAMTVLFDCALLTIGAFGLILSVILGFVLFMMAIGFIGVIARSKSIPAYVTIALVVVLFIAGTNTVLRLWSGPGRVGEGLRWWIIAPVIIDAVVAAGFSVMESIRK